MPINFSGYNFFKNLKNINKFTINGAQSYFVILDFFIINVSLCYSIMQHFLSSISHFVLIKIEIQKVCPLLYLLENKKVDWLMGSL